MIVSHNIPWKDIKLKLDEEGAPTLIWKCPFCKREAKGVRCECGASTLGLRIEKDYTDRGMLGKIW